MAKTPESISFSAFEKALKTLNDGLNAPPKSELERDGVIQRFEYTFEMAWKSIRSLFLALGRSDVSASPRPLFRAALQEGLIQDFKPWDRYLEARNESTHTYSVMTADEVYDQARKFPGDAGQLLMALQRKVKESLAPVSKPKHGKQ